MTSHWRGRGYDLIAGKIKMTIKNDRYSYMNIIHIPSGDQKKVGGIYSIPMGESITFKKSKFRLYDTFIVCALGILPLFIS